MTSYERTGWRDQALSERHRDYWGVNCPAVDLDFLMVEYHLGRPVALVEYTRYTGRPKDVRHPTYRALTVLADAAAIPFFITWYWPDIWAFRVVPVNLIAKGFVPEPRDFTEVEYVTKLHELRRAALEQVVLSKLQSHRPPLTFDG